MIGQEDKKVIIKRVLIELLLFAALLLGDLISKDLVMNRLGLQTYRQYVIVDRLFAIYPCLNDGASFSAFSGKTGFLIALTSILTLAMAALMIFNLLKKPRTSVLFRWSLLLILTGGVGNLYDRIFCDGKVRDFIQYLFLDDLFDKLFDSSFGIGNIADIYLVLGVFLLVGYIVFDYKEGDIGFFKPKKTEVIDDSNAKAQTECAEVEAGDGNVSDGDYSSHTQEKSSDSDGKDV